MTIEIDALIETYSVMKEYIPSKERQGAADTLMSVMIDILSDQDIEQLAAADSYLKRSYQEYVNDDTDDSDEGYDEE